MPMTNAEWPKRYRQRLKEKYLSGELKKKGIRKAQGKGDCKFGGDKKERQKGNKSTEPPKKQAKLQLHLHTQVKVC